MRSTTDRSRSDGAGARLLFVGRVLVSLGALVLLTRNIAWADISGPLRQSLEHWPLLLVALLLPGVGLLIAVARWRLLLSPQGGNASIGTLFSASLVASFFNQFLPSTVGGDFVRSQWIGKSIGSRWLSLAIVGLDRALGLLGTCAVAFIAALLSPAIARQIPQFWTAWALISLGTVAALALVLVTASVMGRERLPFGLSRVLPPRVRLIAAAFAAYRRRKGRLLMAFLLSMAVQAAIVVQYLVLMTALGRSVPAREFAVVVSIVTLIALIPVAINGIGLRESALAALGVPFGLSAADAVALGAMLILAVSPYALIGGFIYFKTRSEQVQSTSGLVPLTEEGQL